MQAGPCLRLGSAADSRGPSQSAQQAAGLQRQCSPHLCLPQHPAPVLVGCLALQQGGHGTDRQVNQSGSPYWGIGTHKDSLVFLCHTRYHVGERNGMQSAPTPGSRSAMLAWRQLSPPSRDSSTRMMRWPAPAAGATSESRNDKLEQLETPGCSGKRAAPLHCSGLGTCSSGSTCRWKPSTSSRRPCGAPV